MKYPFFYANLNLLSLVLRDLIFKTRHSFTSTVTKAKIRESPDISQADSVSNAGEEKVKFTAPFLTFFYFHLGFAGRHKACLTFPNFWIGKSSSTVIADRVQFDAFCRHPEPFWCSICRCLRRYKALFVLVGWYCGWLSSNLSCSENCIVIWAPNKRPHSRVIISHIPFILLRNASLP